jgi:hypothetical protein
MSTPAGNLQARDAHRITDRLLVEQRLINVSALPEARSGWKAKGAGVLCASGKAFGRGHPVGATDESLYKFN